MGMFIIIYIKTNVEYGTYTWRQPEFFFNLFILWALALRLVLKSDGFM
jgi:hypothetical protein